MITAMNVLHLSRHERMDRRITGEMNHLVRTGARVCFLTTTVDLAGAGVDPRVNCIMPSGGESHGPVSRKAQFRAWIRQMILSLPICLAEKVYAMLIQKMDRKMYASFEAIRREHIPTFVPDVIHIHDLRLGEYGIYLKERFPNVRLIYDAHEFTPFQSSNLHLEHYLIGREKRIVHGMDAVITVNESIAERMSELYGIAKPFVIYNSAEDSVCDKPVTSADFKKHFACDDLSDNIVSVLFQGSFSENRNIETLIKAFALLPDRFHLFLLGSGRLKESLQKMAGRNVHFGESVVQTDLLSFTRCASFGIIPYLGDYCENNRLCTPNKLFEFISACIPICASSLPELEKIISECGNGISGDMSSAEHIAALIIEMEKHQEAGDFSVGKLEFAKERFSYKKQMDTLDTIYETISKHI